jgi:TATA-box binding protein (TBP) (component of TFIID and TFIIIB)
MVDLSKIISEMKSNGCNVTFNPSTYSAVKIKFKPKEHMKQVTASIFSSGKVIVTGAVSLDEILAAYSFITRTVYSDPTTRLRPVETADSFDIFAGYSLAGNYFR